MSHKELREDSRMLHNCEHHNCTPSQMRKAEVFWGMKMNKWPTGLKRLAEEKARTYGLCGEVLFAAIVDWVKEEIK